jgi:hypothetical protein
MDVSSASAFAINSRAPLSFWWARDGGTGEEEEAEEQVDGERGRFLLLLGDAVVVVVGDMAQWLLAVGEEQDRLGGVEGRRLIVCVYCTATVLLA